LRRRQEHLGGEAQPLAGGDLQVDVGGADIGLAHGAEEFADRVVVVLGVVVRQHGLDAVAASGIGEQDPAQVLAVAIVVAVLVGLPEIQLGAGRRRAGGGFADLAGERQARRVGGRLGVIEHPVRARRVRTMVGAFEVRPGAAAGDVERIDAGHRQRHVDQAAAHAGLA
jgi:hypothetical protein